jgi:hypothetical protein
MYQRFYQGFQTHVNRRTILLRIFWRRQSAARCPPEKSQLTIIERHGSFFAVNKWLALHMGPYRPNFLPVIVFL